MSYNIMVLLYVLCSLFNAVLLFNYIDTHKELVQCGKASKINDAGSAGIARDGLIYRFDAEGDLVYTNNQNMKHKEVHK